MSIFLPDLCSFGDTGATASMQQNRAKSRILFLDDEPRRAELVRAAFLRAGDPDVIDVVSSPAAAVEILLKEPVDVLFFNRMLSEGNPAHFMREVAANATGPVAQVMMIPDGSEKELLEAISDGADESTAIDSASIMNFPRLASRARARQTRSRPAVRDMLLDVHWQATIGSLVSGVCHDLNNQLTGAIGYAELLVQESGNDALRQDLNLILTSAERCKKTVENLHVFSRRQPAKRPESVNAIIDRAIDLLGYVIRSKGITVIRDYGDMSAFFIDGQQLQRAILHVLMNAGQMIAGAGKADGTITVTTGLRKADRVAVISIADNGPGIPAGFFPPLVAPFFGAASARNSIGLNDCDRIVAGLGGTLHVESREEGAIFRIELPVPDA